MPPLNIPPSVLDDLPALVKAKPKISWNPLVHLWTAWEHFSYFFAPASGCQFCWTLRMFILGFILGVECMWWFPGIKFW